MTDYIERDELVSYFKAIATEELRDGSVERVLGAGVIATMALEIKKFPAADVRPVVRGRWIVHDYGAGDINYECSECKEISCCGANFCPDCGADMREDEG